ncbi:MAG: hypothetical protein JO372_20145 [Solirubrobacterales bacterium]|nr:hypothetical protein [Solirubrobacterales bacterium]
MSATSTIRRTSKAPAPRSCRSRRAAVRERRERPPCSRSSIRRCLAVGSVSPLRWR